jgi:hypothetical protein
VVYKFTVDTQTPRVKEIREDLRRLFDQESSRLNQAIFNDQPDQIRESTIRSVVPLLEILARF